MDVFPSRTEVWDLNGKVLCEIRNSHVAEEAPSARDAVVPGIRIVNWRPDVPATLVMVEALDKGNPRTNGPEARSGLALVGAIHRSGDTVHPDRIPLRRHHLDLAYHGISNRAALGAVRGGAPGRLIRPPRMVVLRN